METKLNELTRLLADHSRLIQATAKPDNGRLQEKHILILIKAELRNHCLIHNLERIGLSDGDFYSDTVTVIFELMNIPILNPEDDLVRFYYSLLEKHTELPIKPFIERLSETAKEVYEELLNLRLKSEPHTS